MSKRTNLMSLAAMFVLSLSLSVTAQTLVSPVQPLMLFNLVSDTDRDRDGLMGPVRRIRTETTKLTNKGGKPVEGQRQVLETAAYDLKGGKVENAYFPVAGGATLTGREVYKYDDKGNISEMTLYNADGSLLSKEVYTYEYDYVGNWTKMTTSVAVVEGGKISFEPTEVTYRTISYYLDENLAKMVQPPPANAAATTTTPAANNAATASNNSPATSNPVNAPATNKPAAGNTTAPAQNNAAQNNAAQKAAAIPPSTNVASLSKNTVAAPANTTSVPGGASANASNKPVQVVMEGEPPVNQPPAPKPLMKPVSGGVLNGKALSLPAPEYPEMAKRMRATGLVTVDVVIDVNGKVISAKASGGNAVLQQAAVKAAYLARFSPTTLSGQPVKVSGTINYNFSLNK